MKTIPFNYDNVDGLTFVYAIPVSSLAGFETDYIHGTKRPLIGNTGDVICIPVIADASFVFTETQSREEGGELWQVQLSGLIPKLSAESDPLIRTLERGEWLVLHQDANGTVQLSGTRDVPLRFASNKTTGQETTNGNSFTFTASEAEPSLIIHDNPFSL